MYINKGRLSSNSGLHSTSSRGYPIIKISINTSEDFGIYYIKFYLLLILLFNRIFITLTKRIIKVRVFRLRHCYQSKTPTDLSGYTLVL